MVWRGRRCLTVSAMASVLLLDRGRGGQRTEIETPSSARSSAYWTGKQIREYFPGGGEWAAAGLIVGVCERRGLESRGTTDDHRRSETETPSSSCQWDDITRGSATSTRCVRSSLDPLPLYRLDSANNAASRRWRESGQWLTPYRRRSWLRVTAETSSP